jgi:hypothetical protein
VGARFAAPVQTVPGAQPASYTRGTDCFPEVKWQGRGVDYPPLSSAEVEEEYSYTSPPPLAIRGLFYDKLLLNPLNAELNPICHLLILLEDLTFTGPCIVSIFQYICNKMQRYTVYLYLKTALHVSGGTSTHHQERIQLYLQHLVFVTPLLLSAAFVEELEPV